MRTSRLLDAILVVSFMLLLAPCAAIQASIIYAADLSGANESPPINSEGIGSARVDYDSTARTLRVVVSFSGLTGTTTAAHIHCCTADTFAGTVGVATTTPTFPGFPVGVASGSYDETFDLSSASSFNSSFITANGGTADAAEAALAAGLANGRAYFNIHTSFATGGEIRGFLAPVPLPNAVWLLGFGLLGMIGVTRRETRRGIYVERRRKLRPASQRGQSITPRCLVVLMASVDRESGGGSRPDEPSL